MKTNRPLRSTAPDQPPWAPWLRRPQPRLGWWAVGLALMHMLLSAVDQMVFMRSTFDAPWRTTVMPIYGIVTLACGLAAGLVGLIAILRQIERSWLVWLAILTGLGTVLLIMGELLIPH